MTRGEGRDPMRPDPPLPPLAADLLLLHAPAYFDFRGRRDIYFPFLGTSGDVPITPLYEYFPLGFKSLERYLSERGHEVRLLNLSSLLLRYPDLRFESIARALETPLIGIDLHWMVHVQGSLAVAERLKALLPDVRIILGGISATYYADELIRYPFVDLVMRGYDTHRPVDLLLSAVKRGVDPSEVPNLLWKDREGRVRANPFTHKPDRLYCGVDWSTDPADPCRTTLPIFEFLSAQSAGCARNCGWCGGSREAFQRVYDTRDTLIRKAPSEIAYEFETVDRLANADQHHCYSVGSYNLTQGELEHLLDRVAESRVKSISFEQFQLTPDDVLRRMVSTGKRVTITLSPESHDQRISRLAGRGVYSNDELERWIERALGYGVSGVDIWYFVGMPGQDERSVHGTVDYCRELLAKFRGTRVNPMICPMIPFLDPGSTFFESPERHGYRVFYRSVEDHRRGMERASIINRLNYETRDLSRADLVHVGFRAVRDLMEAKAHTGFLPRAVVDSYNLRIDEALAFIDVVHEADCIDDPQARKAELEALGGEILRRNDAVLYAGVMNQAFPVNREIGGRWFDEFGWEPAFLDAVASNGAAGRADH